MPCYSRTTVRLTSKMQGIDKVAEAAKAAGYEISGQSKTYLIVEDPRTGTTINYQVNGDYINGTSYDNESDVQAMTVAIQRKYAETRIRQWADGKGYNVVKGQKAGQFDLVQRSTVRVGAGSANNYRR